MGFKCPSTLKIEADVSSISGFQAHDRGGAWSFVTLLGITTLRFGI